MIYVAVLREYKKQNLLIEILLATLGMLISTCVLFSLEIYRIKYIMDRNPNTTSQSDAVVFLLLGIIIVLLCLLGYSMIRSIFQISLLKDMRFWGSLRLIGVTIRQIKCLLYRRLIRWSIIVIPFIIIGSCFWYQMVCKILGSEGIIGLSIGNVLLSTFISFLIILGTCFSAILYLIKHIKRIDPILLLTNSSSEKNAYGKGKQRDKDLLRHIIIDFICLNPKRYRTIILTFLLIIFIIQSIGTFLDGLREEKYLSIHRVADYVITKSSDNMGKKWDKSNAIPQDLIKKFKDHTQIDIIHGVLTPHVFSKKAEIRYRKFITDRSYLFSDKTSGKQTTAIHSVGKIALSQIEIYRGKVDTNKFNKGDQVIVGPSYYESTTDPAFYEPGDPITISDPKGKLHSYTVMAIGQLNPLIQLDGNTIKDRPKIYLLETEYKKFYQQSQDERIVLLNVKKSEQKRIDKILDKARKIDPHIIIDSETHRIKDFKKLIHQFKMVSISLLFGFSLVSFTQFLNITIYNLLDQIEELQLLELIGCTKRQIYRMFLIESAFLFVSLGLISYLFILPLTVFGIKELVSAYEIFDIRYNAYYISICLGIVAFGNFGLRVVLYRQISKSGSFEREC